MKAKSHTFLIRVHFDKKCTVAHALREVRDSIHGEFYTTAFEDGDPDEFRVRAILRRPKADRK